MSALPSKGRMVARALLKRCPICGQGKLFHRWFTMRERCPRCGLRFGQGEGAFLGSISLGYGIAGLAFFAYLGVVLALTLPDPPIVLLTAGSLGVIVVTILVVFPWSKSVWAAIEVMLHDPADLDVAPPHERL